MTKVLSFFRGFATVCLLQKFCYVGQNSMENCNSAVWFLLFSLALWLL